MQEDLIIKLTSFGFTVNQAKVYLSILQSGKTRVGKISKNTQLHRQDIYKLLPKLEKMGLIIRTIEKPFMIEAIPVDQALDNIISKEREKSKQRILQLKTNLKKIVNEIQEHPCEDKEAHFTLLTTDEAIKSRVQALFENNSSKLVIKMVANPESLTYPSLNNFRNFLQMISKNKIRLKLLIVTNNLEDSIRNVVQKALTTDGQLKAKSIEKCVCKDYLIVGNREVWISTEQKTLSGYSSLLWTNDKNIVDAYKGNFGIAWNYSSSSIIFQNNSVHEKIEKAVEDRLIISP
jgi:sugar-specific transcriptional regulator TrmB